MCVFNFVRCCQIGLQNDRIRWHSHQQRRRQHGLWSWKVWVKSCLPLDSCGTQLQCPHRKHENNAVDPRRTCEVCSTGWWPQAFLTITSPTFSGLPYRTAPCYPSSLLVTQGCHEAQWKEWVWKCFTINMVRTISAHLISFPSFAFPC